MGRGGGVAASSGGSAATIVIAICITIIILTVLVLGALFYSRLRKRGERSFSEEEVGDAHVQDGEVLETGQVGA